MANTFAPNGFQQYQGTGTTPSYEQVTMAIASGNTTSIYFGDPVVMSAGTTGVGTGYINQAYGPITLTVGATAITTNATTGALTVTITAPTTSTSGNLPSSPNAFTAPIGSYITIVGSTMTSGNLNGTYQVTSATSTTIVCANAGATINATSTASGVVTLYTPIAGVFVGCRYLSTSQKRVVWGNYWPGADATGDVQAYVVTDPNAQFIVQTGNSNTTATAVGLASVGQNIGFNYNDSVATGETLGNTANGLSTYFADQYSLIANSNAGAVANNFLPFRIIGLANYLPGQTSPLVSINGNDSTTAYNKIIVGFNNSMMKALAGI